jgi:hypothetical protein
MGKRLYNEQFFYKPVQYKFANEQIQFIFEHLCSVANIDFKTVDFNSEHWFNKFYWNEEKEKEFSEWFCDHLYNNKEARRALMSYPKKTKRDIKKTLQEFLLQYGWRRAKVKQNL